jgi:uncharacterized damage-inducible protein DinB
MRALIVCLFAATAAFAQENPLSAFNKRAYSQVSSWLLASAERMPESGYSFRPADTVRTFGQIVGHVADVQFAFCSAVLGEKNPPPRVEQTKTSKADLVAALKDGFAYCDRAYSAATDASGVQMIKFAGSDMPKLSVLQVNIAHCSEHYGNLVTYLRMKNIVPPSTEAMQSQGKR